MPPKARALGAGAGLRRAGVGDGGGSGPAASRAPARALPPSGRARAPTPAEPEPELPIRPIGPGLSMECSWTRPSRPTTPVTTPSREAGICGDAVLTIGPGGRRPAACTDSSGVPERRRDHRRRAADGQQRAARLGRADRQPLDCAGPRRPGPPRPGSARTALHTAPRSGSAGSPASRASRRRRRPGPGPRGPARPGPRRGRAPGRRGRCPMGRSRRAAAARPAAGRHARTLRLRRAADAPRPAPGGGARTPAAALPQHAARRREHAAPGTNRPPVRSPRASHPVHESASPLGLVPALPPSARHAAWARSTPVPRARQDDTAGGPPRRGRHGGRRSRRRGPAWRRPCSARRAGASGPPGPRWSARRPGPGPSATTTALDLGARAR